MSRKRSYLPKGRLVLPVLGAFLIVILFLSAYLQQGPSLPPNAEGPAPKKWVNNAFNTRYFKEWVVRKGWVDSVFNTLTEDEKIGQLFSIRALSNKDERHYQEIEEIIRKYKIGGLTFFQGSPYQQARLSNRYQKVSRIPLMIAIDAEWGLGMRLDSTISFPHQMTLGAIQDDALIYEMGEEIGKHCKRIGIHVNFAPVVDINNNPYNPVIGDRSFGENKINVARKGVAYMKGMQAQGIIANAKHFPGHGDTNKDSHLTLPVINHSRTRIDSLELYPFKSLINAGLMSTMVAHLKIPSLDNRPNLPTTLSDKVVNELLVNKLGFNGLVFTDALEMKGVANYFPPGEISLRALKAGNDVLLLPNDLGQAIRLIKASLQKKELSWAYIDNKVKKILSAKYFNGLHEYKAVNLAGIQSDLNHPHSIALQTRLYQKAITVAKDDEGLLPLDFEKYKSMATVVLGNSEKNIFQKELDHYGKFNHYQASLSAYPQVFKQLLSQLKQEDLVIVSIHGMNKRPKENYGISLLGQGFIRQLQAQNKVILMVNGSPYSLKLFSDAKEIVCSYEDNEMVEKLNAQMLVGAFGAEGKLPVSAGRTFKSGMGVKTKDLSRLKFGAIPEEAGLNSDTLIKIDEILNQALRDKAFPGCQFVVARKGKVVWNKNYGFHSYARKNPVNRQTVYDVASVTKVAATLQAIMYLYEQGEIELDRPIADYLPELKASNKSKITIREVLSHQAGLAAYLPFWKETVNDSGLPNPRIYQRQKSSTFSLQVSRNLYAKNELEETLMGWVIDTVRNRKKKGEKYYPYVYSDLGMYLLKSLIEKKLGQAMETFLAQRFYEPLGMDYTLFNPLQKFSLHQIPPTEQDNYFRKELIQGTVHDQGAAMLGGVGGHAGLFSRAQDLAAFMQMHLQGGYYQGKRYFRQETVDLFTKTQYPKNRRGLGWDKNDDDTYSYISDSASVLSFGHSGFTGCVVWADPKEELVMVFLSNRIHPSVDNRLLISNQIRRKIQNVVYQAILPDPNNF